MGRRDGSCCKTALRKLNGSSKRSTWDYYPQGRHHGLFWPTVFSVVLEWQNKDSDCRMYYNRVHWALRYSRICALCCTCTEFFFKIQVCFVIPWASKYYCSEQEAENMHWHGNWPNRLWSSTSMSAREMVEQTKNQKPAILIFQLLISPSSSSLL